MKTEPAQSSDATQVEEEMLPTEPPPIATRLLASLLIALFTVSLVVSSCVPLPETVRCPFVLISESGSDPIQARLFAALHQINIAEGDEVKGGEVMFKLRSDEIINWRTQLNTAEEDLRSNLQRRPKAEESFAKQQSILASRLTNAVLEIEYSQEHLENRGKIAKRMDELFDKKLISEEEWELAQLDLNLSRRNLSMARQQREQVELELQQATTDREQQRTAEQAEESKLRERIAGLGAQLENCEGNLMLIRAPYDAVVISVPNRNPGSVVDEGDDLCLLAPADGRAVARLFLTDASLPKLEPDSGVRLFFDAFPYQRYGMIDGTLEWISPASVETPEGPRFIGRATLSTNEILVKILRRDENGKTEVVPRMRPLKIGMRGEARIDVGGRTLLESAFEPINQLRYDTQPFPAKDETEHDSVH